MGRPKNIQSNFSRNLDKPHLRVLRLGDVHQSLGGRVDDVELLHDGRAVVGDDGLARRADDQLVHAAGTERGSDGVDDGLARVDVGDQLRPALVVLGAFFEEDDLGLLK